MSSNFIFHEWYRSVWLSPKYRQQNRDFFWLFLALLITLVLLIVLLGGRNGFLNKVSEISMGYMPNAGIPVWLMRNSSGASTIIPGEELASGQDVGSVYPYKILESDLQLPKGAWGKGILPTIEDKELSPIVWAISRIDPLWGLRGSIFQETVKVDPFQPRVLLNRKEFQQYFNCDVYNKYIEEKAPYIKLTVAKSTDDDPLSCLSGNIIILPIKYDGGNPKHFPFIIYWVDKIPLIADTKGNAPSLLVSEEAYSVAYAQANDGSTPWDVYLLPESIRQDGLIRKINLKKQDPSSYNEFLNCLKSYTLIENKLFPIEYKGRSIVHGELALVSGMPTSFVSTCAESTNVKFSDSEPKKLTYRFTASDSDMITIQCEGEYCNLCDNVNESRKKYFIDCTQKELSFNSSKIFPPRDYAYLYVKSRQSLERAITDIEKSNKYTLQPSYYSALIRFLFVDKIFNILVAAAAILLFVFFVIFLWTQIGIIIGHRRHDYGIMLAMGKSQKTLMFRLVYQSSLSYGMALIFAVGLYLFFLKPYLNNLLIELSQDKRFSENVILVNNNLLDLTQHDWVILIGFSYLALLITIWIYFLSSINGKEPCKLF